jgi:hypothetical protein
MRPIRTHLAKAAIAMAVAVGAAIATAAKPQPDQAGQKTDLTGKWLFNVTTDAGTGTPTVTFKQKGDSVTGHYSSQLLGEAELKGSVKEKTFTFVLTADVQGNTITVTYAGTMESNDSLKGTVDLGGAASGTFTAKRQTP